MPVPVVTAAFKEASRMLPRHSICGLTVCKVQGSGKNASAFDSDRTTLFYKLHDLYLRPAYTCGKVGNAGHLRAETTN